MFELLVLNALYPGFIALLIFGGVVGLALVGVLYVVGAIIKVLFAPYFERLEREERARREQLRRESEARQEKERIAREKDAARKARMIERGAQYINGELCPVKTVAGKQWIKVRGHWQRYV